MYKLQFRGLQQFRVKHDDHGVLIFVVVNAALQKTSVWMYRGEKDAASREGIETRTCPFEDRETLDLFLPSPFPRHPPKKVPIAGARLWTTKSSLIIHWGFSPHMRAVGLPLFTDLASMPQKYRLLAEPVCSGTWGTILPGGRGETYLLSNCKAPCWTSEGLI